MKRKTSHKNPDIEIVLGSLHMTNSPKTECDFNRLRYVLSCISSDQNKPELKRVKIEKSGAGVTIVATDGRRLRKDYFGFHMAPGIYDIKKNTKTTVQISQCLEELHYPFYRHVIPTFDSDKGLSFEITGKPEALWACAASGQYLDPDLLEIGNHETFELKVPSSSHPEAALLANEHTTFVIMSMKASEEFKKQLKSVRSPYTKKVA